MNALRIASIIVLLLISAHPAFSLDVSLGVSAWYVRWSPSVEDLLRGEDNGITASDPVNNSAAYNDRFESNPHFMAGPLVNVQFSDKWSVGFVLLMSQSYTLTSSFDVNIPGPATLTTRNDFDYRRYDGDLTANYRIGSGFGVFCGIKYFRWEGTGTNDVFTGTGAQTAHTEVEVLGQAFGPAAGLSFSHPLAGMIFFTASVSGIYMKSNVEQTDERTLPSYEKKIIRTSPHFLGVNSMAGLGYHFISLKSTLIIGGRYQYLKMEDASRDLFYGVTATVMYHF